MILTALLDIGWVFGSGIYGNYVQGQLSPWTIAGLWTIVVVSQSLLLYMLTRGHINWTDRALLGALQGFTVYSVFNITAKVVFPPSMWPTHIAIIDTVWGTLLFAIVAAVSGLISNPGIIYDAAIIHPAAMHQLFSL